MRRRLAMILPFVGIACFASYMLRDLPPTIDWCERNNAVTGAVKEFWNCVSMAPWIVSSAFGLYRTLRFRATTNANANAQTAWVATAWALSLWIALGSLYFHAALTRFSQSMDELPMLFLGLHSATLCERVTGRAVFRPLTRHARTLLVGGSLASTVLYCCSDAYEQFLIPYAIVTTASFLMILAKIIRTEDEGHRRVGLAGVVSMALAITVWAVEQHRCRDWLKLHACWHVGVGVATYAVIAFVAVDVGPAAERVPIETYFPAAAAGSHAKMK